MRRLECLGDICPLPLMKMLQYKEQIDHGESMMIITDQSCTCEAILSYCQKQGISTHVDEPVPGIWEITVHKEIG